MERESAERLQSRSLRGLLVKPCRGHLSSHIPHSLNAENKGKLELYYL